MLLTFLKIASLTSCDDVSVPARENEVYDDRKDEIPVPETRPDDSWKSRYYPFSLDDR